VIQTKNNDEAVVKNVTKMTKTITIKQVIKDVSVPPEGS